MEDSKNIKTDKELRARRRKNKKAVKKTCVRKRKNRKAGEKLRARRRKNRKSGKKLHIIITILALAVMLIFLRVSGNTRKPDMEPLIGNFDMTDKEQEKIIEQKEKNKIITFVGLGEYKISEKAPGIELKNPEKNFADMVFTLTDKATGELIARTNKIPAGKFVYINVMDFYKQKGVYNIKINISTYDPKTKAAMNSMEQEVRVTIN